MTDVRRQKTGDGAELLVSLRLAREGAATAKEIGPGPVRDRRGAVRGRPSRWPGREVELKDHRIPLEQGRRAGLGQGLDPGRRQPGRQRLLVRLRPARRRGGRSIVAEDAAGRPAAAAGRGDRARPGDPVLGRGRRGRPARGGRLGEGRAAALAGPAARGGRGQAGPGVRRARRPGRSSSRPEARATASSSACAGRPGASRRRTSPVETWRGDQDLLANTQSGAALPVGQLAGPQVLRPRRASSRRWPRSRAGAPLLARVDDQRAAASTSARPRRRRRLVAGDQRRRPLRPGPAGAGRRGRGPGEHPAARRPASPAGDDPPRWKRLAGGDEAISTDYAAPPRRLRLGRAAAGREPRRPPKTRRRSWPIAAWPGCSGGSTSPASTTRRATSAR